MHVEKNAFASPEITGESAMSVSPIAAGAASRPMASNVGEGARQFGGGERAVPIRPDQQEELALKIAQPFTVVAVGDLLQFQPFAESNDPDIQYLLEVIRNADFATGDFENDIFDFDNFGHYGLNLATKEVADDWAKMGIDAVSRANNKEQTAPGVWESLRQVERVGIGHVGIGHSLAEARRARYFATPKGLVGFAGVYAKGGESTCCTGGPSVYVTAEQLAQLKSMRESILARRSEVEVPVPLPKDDAPDAVNLFDLTFRSRNAYPRPGDQETANSESGDARKATDAMVNTLHLTRFHGVTAAQLAALQAIAGDTDTGPDLKAFGTQFRLMENPGEYSFDMDPKDRLEILRQIRTGKQASDIMVINAHWHQNRYAFQAYSFDHFPADFEIKFAHEAIDNGADVFVAQGVHTLKGVEIYKGKPIFYGTSNFIFQSSIMPAPVGKPRGATDGPEPDPATQARALMAKGLVPPDLLPMAHAIAGISEDEDHPDAIVGEHEYQGFWQLRSNLEAILTASHFENGNLTEVRIYPVDLGQTPRPGSKVGIPRRPSPEVAVKTLDEVIEYSKPFGTHISVEDGVGIIRLN